MSDSLACALLVDLLFIPLLLLVRLGPAVANIFDSYEVYAGHEVGLIADATPSSGSVEEPQLAVYPEDLGHLTTLKLVPDAKPFKLWLEENRDNAEFRELLGIR